MRLRHYNVGGRGCGRRLMSPAEVEHENLNSAVPRPNRRGGEDTEFVQVSYTPVRTGEYGVDGAEKIKFIKNSVNATAEERRRAVADEKYYTFGPVKPEEKTKVVNVLVGSQMPHF